MSKKRNEVPSVVVTPQDYFEKNNVLLKSNVLISAKYKATLMELKITYFSMLSLQQDHFVEDDYGLRVELPASKIKQLLGMKGNSIYETLDPVARNMGGHTIGYSDPQRKVFDYMSFIVRAKYENAVMKVWFGKAAMEYLQEDRSGFTRIEKKIINSFNSAYAFRLYEIIRKNCYYPKNYEGPRSNVFSFTIGLAELKLEMGVVNASYDAVRKELQSGGANPDYEKAISKAPERIKSYNTWSNFRQRCLDPAIREICEVSDIFVEYETKRSGRGGKITQIEFISYLEGAHEKPHNPVPMKLENNELKPAMSDAEKFMTFMDISNLFPGCKLQYEEIESIWEESDYDMNVIKQAANVVAEYHEPINNIVGFIISAMKNDYKTHYVGTARERFGLLLENEEV